MKDGPFFPVQIFKHGSQTIYNKTKGGVDGNAQMRAILRCPTDTLKWEQKLVTQVLKSLAVNSWVGWRQLQKQDLLRTRESFKGLDQYRNALNKIESFADFIFEVTPQLLAHADKLDKEEENAVEHGEQVETRRIKKPEVARIIAKAKSRKRYRLNFFNSSDGITLRIQVKGHDHFTGSDFYCALCGNNKTKKNVGFRGHRSRVICKKCNVHLCVKVRKGYRRSCWDVWHSIKTLKSRQPQPLETTQEDEENDMSEEDDSIEEIQTRSREKRRELRST